MVEGVGENGDRHARLQNVVSQNIFHLHMSGFSVRGVFCPLCCKLTRVYWKATHSCFVDTKSGTRVVFKNNRICLDCLPYPSCKPLALLTKTGELKKLDCKDCFV